MTVPPHGPFLADLVVRGRLEAKVHGVEPLGLDGAVHPAKYLVHELVVVGDLGAGVQTGVHQCHRRHARGGGGLRRVLLALLVIVIL